ncbi:glycosyltransferase [Apilactobacillus bombintestini]|uniref:Glycosyltransferase n=1 Tax=Apilactobacillus bombintestini TaxID=2419772 RepID=A0A387ATN4_9LACO|nr:glycosyltransferase [Apilactobacillus bombintestini]AYF92096.1 glycosyltransferase [Apilactobacillus bombintestini]
MNFFLNSSFNAKNSGIEHAQLKRAKLFEKFGEDYRIVFHVWNPLLHYYLNKNDIADQHILNVFDYFQQATHVERKIIHPKDIDFGVSPLTYERDEEQHRLIVYSNQQIVARINLFGKDITDDEIVKSVELFDGFNNLYCVDFYDYRGFLSMSQWYTPDNKIATETWYTPDGYPAVEDYFRKNALGKIEKSGYKTISPKGTVRTHHSIAGLLKEFLEDINLEFMDKNHPNIYVMDRSDYFEEILEDLSSPTYTALYIHSSHAGDAQRPDTSIMNNNYEYTLTNANRYDAIICSTKKQTRDVTRRFNTDIDMFAIPVGVIKNKDLKKSRIPVSNRKKHSIVITARVSPEKQINKIIDAMGMAKKEVPDINMDVYGYIDHSNNDIAMKRINKSLEKYDLKNAVHLHDYTNDVAKVQSNAQVYALASVMEGFNLALLEAQNQGDVGITFNTNYGPNELIVDQKNGYIVDYDDTKALSNRMVKLFTDDKLLQKMSDKAYDLSSRFSEDNVWKAWEKLLQAAKKSWREKLKAYHFDIQQGLSDMEHGKED